MNLKPPMNADERRWNKRVLLRLCVSPVKSNACRGVTLLEMLIVVAIIGLIVGVSAPSISAGIDSVRLRTATSSVASFFNAAVTSTERRQLPIQVTIAPQAGLLEARSMGKAFHRELKLPDGITIEKVLDNPLAQPVEGVPWAPAGDAHFLLIPGTTAPGFGITLANSHGVRRTVKLDPLTGYPRVENVQNQ